ncbi:MAG: HalD/BesD family halogenase [Paracoccaceae bacterium]
MVQFFDLVDLGKYPIDRPGSPAYERMIADLRRELQDDGCAVLARFVHDNGIKTLVAEANSVAAKGHKSFSRTNAYFNKEDPKLPADHPARRFYDRSNAFIPADNFKADSPLRQIYEYPMFMPFVRDALEEPEERFFRYDDPLADVIINMVKEGQGFPWHFDTNKFTVTLAIQNGLEGGEFEYAPNLRSPTDENYDGVKRVLAGSHAQVRRLDLKPGDLQIFKGRYSLHRVAPVGGQQPRYVAIFSFVEKEGMCGGVERTKQLYGRVLPHHFERAGLRADRLRD